MKTALITVFCAAVCLVSVGVADAMQSTKPAPVNPLTKLPAGPDYDTTIRVCSACHEIDMLTTKPPYIPWAAVVQSMVERGSSATLEEQAQIADYLTRNLPDSALGNLPER